MTEKRHITKSDVLLKTRFGFVDTQIDVKELPRQAINGFMVLDDCGIHLRVPPLPTPPHPSSTDEASSSVTDRRSKSLKPSGSGLTLTIDGNHVTISEMGEVLATATLEPRASWRDKRMSDGRTVDSVIICQDDCQCALLVGNRCYTTDAGKACKFCGLGPQWAQGGPPMSFTETLKAAEPAIEATAIAIKNGWRGFLIFGGGATLPERRGQWTTDLLEAIMARFHEVVDADTLSELQIAPQVYPPPDLGELNKWKSFGINSAEFDNQVMDPAHFKAVCPGRGDQKHWFEAQEAAAEVFGRGRGSISNLVTGLEPMAGMLEGIEERISKGVYSFPIIFGPAGALAGMRRPSVEWYVKAHEEIADIYLRYADTLDVDLTEDDRWGYTRRGDSSFWFPFGDEWSRRLQEMGKLEPGLPKQDEIELA